jgi:VanZ family protein
MENAKTRSPGLLVWALRIAVAAGLAGLMLWGGLQDDDPLSTYVQTDKMRHVVAFGAAGLFAALFFSRTRGRLLMVGVVLAFAAALEIAQPIFSTREMELEDLIASAIGVFAGYGFGTATLSTIELLRKSAR